MTVNSQHAGRESFIKLGWTSSMYL